MSSASKAAIPFGPRMATRPAAFRRAFGRRCPIGLRRSSTALPVQRVVDVGWRMKTCRVDFRRPVHRRAENAGSLGSAPDFDRIVGRNRCIPGCDADSHEAANIGRYGHNVGGHEREKLATAHRGLTEFLRLQEWHAALINNDAARRQDAGTLPIEVVTEQHLPHANRVCAVDDDDVEACFGSLEDELHAIADDDFGALVGPG